MIPVTRTLALAEDEIREEFVRASGPGGQNVNKVATAVQLRFDVRRSPSLPAAVRERLLAIAGKKITREGVLVITARRYRTQEQNRRDARERLVDLVRQATVRPRTRRPTEPTRAARERRVEGKVRRATIKRLRGAVGRSEE